MRNRDLGIFHVIGAMVAGGAERFVVNLVQELKAQGHEIGLLALSNRFDRAGQSMVRALRDKEIMFTAGPTRKVRLASVVSYARALVLNQPNIVHLHTPNTELAHLLANRLFRIKPHVIVRTLHTTGTLTSIFSQYAMRKNRAAVSIACSDAVFDQNCEILPGTVVTVENGVSFNWPIRTSALSEAAKKRLTLDPQKRHFLAVGRLFGDSLPTAPKAQDILINAWKRGSLGTRGGELHILGDGSLRLELERLARSDESIQFHGVRDDVKDWLIASDCFVMPSRFEGLPIAGIEAVGTGLPCIFSEIKPLKELQPPAALWFPVDNVKKLAAHLVAVQSGHLAPSVVKIEAFRAQFAIRKTAQQYAKIYRQIQSTRHPIAPV